MDASRLAGEIDVHGAGDYASVGRIRAMKADEMLAVQREEHAVLSGGIMEHFFVRPCLSGTTAFQDGGDVTSEAAQVLNDGLRKILVGIQTKHAPSVRFVFRNRAFDLPAVRVVVCPRMSKILRVQRGIGAEDVRLAETALACANKCPDGDARAADAGFAAADGGIAIHAGKALAEITRDDLQKRGLFTGRHSRQESFGIGKRWHGGMLCDGRCAVHFTGLRVED